MGDDKKKFYWLKLKIDFFDDKVIRKMRRIPGGDTYALLYLKLMLFSLSTDGYIYLDGIEDSPEKELALCINEDPDAIGITLTFGLRHGLIEECPNGDFKILQVKELIGSETLAAERMRRLRAKRQNDAEMTSTRNNVQKR